MSIKSPARLLEDIPVRSLAVSKMTPEAGRFAASRAYNSDRPVVVLSRDGDVLHGADDLRVMIVTQAPVQCHVLKFDISSEDWASTSWPALFEEARQSWLSRR